MFDMFDSQTSNFSYNLNAQVCFSGLIFRNYTQFSLINFDGRANMVFIRILSLKLDT